MSIQLYTYKDIHDHLADVFDVNTTAATRENNLIKRAIVSAYRELPAKHKWKYFERTFTMESEASQSTGTITYTHSTRTVTLSGDTWPTNASLYMIYFASNGATYPIESYTDSTNIVLTETQNPGDDVAAGASFILYRSHYPFPCNFRKMDRAWDVTGNFALRYSPPAEGLGNTVLYSTPSQPTMFSIGADGRYYGALSMVLSPPPSTARTYEFSYQASPRPLTLLEENTGTVTHTAASTTVEGTGTAFDSVDHEGAVIRFGDTTNVPTDREGDYPYKVWRIVSSVTDADTLVIDATPGIAGTTVKYSMSDPIDITSDTMMTYFLRLAELQFSIMTNRKDVRLRAAEEREALKWAAGADARYRDTVEAGGIVPFHLRGWSTIPDEIVN